MLDSARLPLVDSALRLLVLSVLLRPVRLVHPRQMLLEAGPQASELQLLEVSVHRQAVGSAPLRLLQVAPSASVLLLVRRLHLRSVLLREVPSEPPLLVVLDSPQREVSGLLRLVASAALVSLQLSQLRAGLVLLEAGLLVALAALSEVAASVPLLPRLPVDLAALWGRLEASARPMLVASEAL